MVNLLKTFLFATKHQQQEQEKKSHTASGQKVSSLMYSTFKVQHNCQKPISFFSMWMLKEPVSSNEYHIYHNDRNKLLRMISQPLTEGPVLLPDQSLESNTFVRDVTSWNTK